LFGLLNEAVCFSTTTSWVSSGGGGGKSSSFTVFCFCNIKRSYNLLGFSFLYAATLNRCPKENNRFDVGSWMIF
jgi:hypothetical protein